MCASVKYGSVITELKGKVGGQTFQGGKYAPILKNTNRWIKIRHKYIWMDDVKKKQYITQVSQAWGNQTEDVRSDWATAAASFPATNKFGDTYTPSGYQIWCEFNFNLLAIGGDIVTTAPTPPTFPDMSAADFSVDNTTAVIVIGLPYPAEGFKLAIYMGKQMSPGRTLPPGGSKFIAFTDFPAPGTVDVSTPYKKKFGNLTARKKLWGYLRVIHSATGVQSAKQEIFTMVQDG